MSKSLPFVANVDKACSQILLVADEVTQQTVLSIRDYGITNHYITAGQAKTIGLLYKELVNNGQYIHHDWWDDEQLMQFYVNKNNWPCTVSDCKHFAKMCISAWKYKDKQQRALAFIEKARSINIIQQYIINCLLSGEGKAVLR